MNSITPNLLYKIKPFKAIDATWFLPNSGKIGQDEYLKKRLPGAQFFDLDGVSSPSPYPHMMPTKETWDKALSRFGITPSDRVLVYDQGNLFSSPRVYWMFETFGHKDVYILDNFADYEASESLETGKPTVAAPSSYNSSSVGHWVEFEEMEKIAEDPAYTVVDARPLGRFNGTDPEPRAGLSSGHIPGAISLPAGSVLENGHYKPRSRIQKMLEERQLDTTKQVVVMCGSGVTACIIKYAIDPFLTKPALVYDGSWTEWAQRSTSIEKTSV